VGGHAVELVVTDGSDATDTQNFTITVTNVNDAPTFTSAPITTATEDVFYIYNITTTDPDLADILDITFVTKPTWLSLFDKGDGTASLSGTPTNAHVGTHTVELVVTDSQLASDTQDFTITVANVNDTPTEIALSNNQVDENQPVETVVGTFTTTDPDVGDTHTYSLVAGAGDTGNDQFTITGNQLLTDAEFNFEEQSSYSILVRTTDQSGGFLDKNFTISINDLNEAPVIDDQILFTSENMSLTIDLLNIVTDEDEDDLDFTVTVEPDHGSINGTAPDLIYTPDSGYVGQDSFTISVDDGTVQPIGIITINILEHHCLSVDPASIHVIQYPGVTTTMDLSITNACSEIVDYEVFEGSVITFEEGFESGNIPTSQGWEVFHYGSTSNQWKVWSVDQTVYEGEYTAWVGYDNFHPSDEWLRSPVIDISALDNPYLSFSTWTNTLKPGATMEVWALDSTGVPLTDEPIWDLIEDENWDLIELEFRRVYLDLSSFVSEGAIRIDWRYVGQEGQSFALDDIKVGGADAIDWLSSDPALGSIPSSSTFDVTLTFDTTALASGTYTRSIFVRDPLFDLVEVPVEMIVGEYDYAIYLPLINR
jgi:hypothetical protein